jgi:uncharacterized protein
MSDQKTTEEPSIEDILGSIRRIIADDDQEQPIAATSAPAPQPASAPFDDEEDDEPLELTQKLDDEGTVIDLQPETQGEELASGEPAMDESDDESVALTSAYAAASSTPDDYKSEITMVDQDNEMSDTAESLVSSVAADATAAVMAKLARNTAVTRGAAIDGLTIEDIVRDLLRPMLRSWLDENLPDMVQNMVERELDRIARRVG